MNKALFRIRLFLRNTLTISKAMSLNIKHTETQAKTYCIPSAGFIKEEKILTNFVNSQAE